MRVGAFISIVVLGGSAAALAQVAGPPVEQKTGDATAGNSDMPGMAMPPNADDPAHRTDTPTGNAADPGKSRR